MNNNVTSTGNGDFEVNYHEFGLPEGWPWTSPLKSSKTFTVPKEYEDHFKTHEMSEKPDNVNHPSHYTKGKIEVIDMMLKVFGKEVVINYCDLNAFKYRMRAGYKNDIVEDINKAMWYENKSKELSEK